METAARTTVVIGTRGSELAKIQAQMVANALRVRWSQLAIEIKIIRTSGDDAKIDITNAHAGLKGLFTAEIERALIAGDVDLAVHSAKDLPSELTSETAIAAVLPRGEVEDVLVAIQDWDLNALPHSAFVATSSVRRKHQLRWKRPDLEIVDLRGNVPTRLRKLASGRWHAVVLAGAGLKRLGLCSKAATFLFEDAQFFTTALPTENFVPAGGQGIVAAQIRSDDERLRVLLEPLNDFDTRLCLRAEREFLRLLQADCNQPVGVLAHVDGATMQIRAQVFAPGATTPRQAIVEGPAEDAEKLATKLLERINGD